MEGSNRKAAFRDGRESMKKRSASAFAGPVLAVIGVVGIVVGVLQGETGVVLEKAIKICLECIGIG